MQEDIGSNPTHRAETSSFEPSIEYARHFPKHAYAPGSVGGWTWDPGSDQISWSTELYHLFGVEPHKFNRTYSTYLALVHPEDRRELDAAVRACLNEGLPYSLEHRIIRPDGTERIVHSSGDVVHDSQGRAVRLVGTAQDVTDLRRAEEAAYRLAEIVQSSGEAILSFTTEGGILSWNPAAERMYGYAVYEALGKSPAILFPRDHILEYQALFDKVLAGARINGYETSQLHRNGTRFEVSLSIAPIQADGRIHGASLVVRDISERIRFQREIEQREEEYRRILETTNEGVWRIDADSRTVYANAVMAAMLGCSRADLIGRSMFEFMDASERTVAERNIDRRKNGIAERHEFKLRSLDGREIWTEMGASPIFDENGTYQGALAMVTDVTERKRIQKEREQFFAELQRQKEWLEAMIKHSSAGIVLLDAKRPDVLRLNRRACELFGWPAERETAPVVDFEGRLTWGNDHRVSAGRLRTHALTRGGRFASAQMVIRRDDGTRLFALSSVAQVREENGNVLGAIGILEDVSELKRLQQLREEWTSLVAHDLRQPLAAIIAKTELMNAKFGHLGPELLHGFDQVLGSAHQLQRLIGDLSDLSLLESNQLKLMYSETDLNSLVQAIVERTTYESVKVLPAAGAPRIRCDASRVEQVLLNLLSNAVKYGKTGTPVEVLLNLEKPGWVTIAVSNQGEPLSPKQLSGIFNRFQRGGSAAGKEGGLGLGLYIARGIVEAHGGTITAASNDGVNTFTVRLPAAA